MSIRRKFFISLLFVSLIPLLLSSFVAREITQTAAIRWAVNELQALTEIQKKRINEVVFAYLEQVRYLSAYPTVLDIADTLANQSAVVPDQQRSESFIKSMRQFSGISEMSLITLQGSVVLSTNSTKTGKPYTHQQLISSGSKSRMLADLYKDENNLLMVRLLGPLVDRQGHVQGVIELLASSSPIVSITEDYTGLGTSGEVELVKRNAAGDTLFLTPLRFNSGASLSTAIPKERSTIPESVAASGIEKVFQNRGDVDAKGNEVLAVTRYIDSLGWGIVAKIDRSEAVSAVTTLSQTFVLITVIATISIFFMALALARGISFPIVELAKFAKRIQDGGFGETLHIADGGELGYLNTSINKMSTTLRELYVGLEQKVAERTRELELSKNRLTLATESAHIGVWEWSIATDTLTWDRQMRSIYTLSLEDNISTLSDWMVLVHHDDRAIVESTFTDAIHKEVPIQLRIRILTKSGLMKHVQLHAIPKIHHKNNQPTLIGVNWDITEEMQADQMKNDFISLASHQLRTPLTAIRWFTELLTNEKQTLSQKQQDTLEKISSSTIRMIELVRSLLNISRIQSGRINITPENIDVNNLLNSIVLELTTQYGKQRIIHVLVSAAASHVNTDKKMLRHAIMNILGNALKYSPEHSGVYVHVDKTDATVVFEIEDMGSGIPASQQSRIFDRFFRADNVLKSEHSGSGLGLYLVRLIAQAMHGSVTFKSTEGKGSTFWFSFPDAQLKQHEGEVSLE